MLLQGLAWMLLRRLEMGVEGQPWALLLPLCCTLRSAQWLLAAINSFHIFWEMIEGNRRSCSSLASWWYTSFFCPNLLLTSHLKTDWRYWCLTNWVLLKCKSLGLFSEVGGALELATDGEDFIVQIFFIINKGKDNRISFWWYCKLCGNQQFGFPHLTELERKGYLSDTDKSINAVTNTSRADFMTLFGIDVYGKKLGILVVCFLCGLFFSFFFDVCLLSLPVFWCFLIDQHKLFLSWLCTVHCKTKLLSWFMASRLC